MSDICFNNYIFESNSGIASIIEILDNGKYIPYLPLFLNANLNFI